jgi:hypothetical protein
MGDNAGRYQYGRKGVVDPSRSVYTKAVAYLNEYKSLLKLNHVGTQYYT